MNRHPFDERVEELIAQRDAESKRSMRSAGLGLVAVAAVALGLTAGIPALTTNEGRGTDIEACEDDPTVVVTDKDQQPVIVSHLAVAAVRTEVTDSFASGFPIGRDYATLEGELLCQTREGRISLLPAGMKAIGATTPSANGLLEGLEYSS